jgi:hypothetical protein
MRGLRANAPKLPRRLALDLSNLLNSLLAVLFKPAASTDYEWVSMPRRRNRFNGWREK